jgi:hypothetical protein
MTLVTSDKKMALSRIWCNPVIPVIERNFRVRENRAKNSRREKRANDGEEQRESTAKRTETKEKRTKRKKNGWLKRTETGWQMHVWRGGGGTKRGLE